MKKTRILRQILIFVIISAGLIYITESILMAVGIMLLLFVISYLIPNIIISKKNNKEPNDSI